MKYAQTVLYLKGKPFWVPQSLADKRGLQYGYEIQSADEFWEIFNETAAEMIRQSEIELQINEQPPVGLYPDPERFKKHKTPTT